MHVADGKVTMVIQSVDVVGNADPHPPEVTWTWDTTPPESAVALIVPCVGSASRQHEFDDGVVVIDAPSVCMNLTCDDGPVPVTGFQYTVSHRAGERYHGSASGNSVALHVNIPSDGAAHNGTPVALCRLRDFVGS